MLIKLAGIVQLIIEVRTVGAAFENI